MIKSKKQSFIVIGVFALLLLVGGTTYAFFNYTRTGTSNTIRVGRMAFSTNQTDTINLTNAFPITRTEAETDTINSDDVIITISGDTDYSRGVEYLVSSVEVTNTVGGKTIPISVIVTPSGSLGTSTDNYYTVRKSATNSIYKQEAGNTIENNGRLLVGYIAPNTTSGTASGISGMLTIRAFLDSDLIAISDTYDGNETDSMGTTSEWVAGRTVLTTSEWNSLKSSGISFKVRVEANEGLWINDQVKYDANGGVVDTKYKEIDINSTTYGLLTIPERTNYVFDGWYTSAAGGTKVDENTAYISGTSAKTLYAHWTALICIRAKVLNTETCSIVDDRTGFCNGQGYSNGSTITYGNLGTSGELHTGDAFDCDVNGDGEYSERFYYVSPYYNTDTQLFDDENGYATLIYYTNTIVGNRYDDSISQYSDSDNWHGPTVAMSHLPKTSQWTNITLKKEIRTILAENGSLHNVTTTGSGANTLPIDFSYTGYAARLLTAQEVMNGCDIDYVGQHSYGEIAKNCEFLMEKTKYVYDARSRNLVGIWLETPVENNSNKAWTISSYRRIFYEQGVNAYGNSFGVRPAIDVPISRIEK